MNAGTNGEEGDVRDRRFYTRRGNDGITISSYACQIRQSLHAHGIYGNGSKLTGVLTTLSGHNVSELTNDAGYVTGAYSPANPGQWATPPPATVAEALDRLAALASNAGTNPIP